MSPGGGNLGDRDGRPVLGKQFLGEASALRGLDLAAEGGGAGADIGIFLGFLHGAVEACPGHSSSRQYLGDPVTLTALSSCSPRGFPWPHPWLFYAVSPWGLGVSLRPCLPPLQAPPPSPRRQVPHREGPQILGTHLACPPAVGPASPLPSVQPT